MATARAAADPLPGALKEAFIGGDINVAKDVTVRRVVASDWKKLKWLDSPILKQMLELQKPVEAREEVPYTDTEAFEICFQFTRPPKDTHAFLLGPRENFREAAIDTIGDKYDLPLCYKIVDAVSEQFAKSFLTALQFMPDEENAEKKSP